MTDWHQVTVNFTEENWQLVQAEAAASGDTETDVINRSAAFYSAMRAQTRVPGTYLAILRNLTVKRGKGPLRRKPVLQLNEHTEALLVTGFDGDGVQEGP